ncbi:SAM-dependent methyltransferase [Sphaerisporangium sp. NPDC005289]|uniref:SAM-dependent methyltransferase n=1 Tax=Sphaerisporangium sp. NPDC005289 TaxID=3155247 RepID=UPI0033AF53A7
MVAILTHPRPRVARRQHRDDRGVARYFEGMDLLEPGLVPVSGWRPASEPDVEIDLSRPTLIGGVAHLPA